MIEAIAWLGTGLQFLGVHLNIHKRHQCWWVWLVASGIMLAYSAVHGNWPVAGLFLGYEMLNLHGLLVWRRDKSLTEIANAHHYFLNQYLRLRNNRLHQDVDRLRHQRDRLCKLAHRQRLECRRRGILLHDSNERG